MNCSEKRMLLSYFLLWRDWGLGPAALSCSYAYGPDPLTFALPIALPTL